MTKNKVSEKAIEIKETKLNAKVCKNGSLFLPLEEISKLLGKEVSFGKYGLFIK